MIKKVETDPTDFQSIFVPSESEDRNEKMEMLNEIVKQNYSTEAIAVKTELNNAQIRAFSVGKLFAKRYDNPLIDNLINEIMTLNISKDRKSRDEFKEIAKSMLGSTNPEPEKSSLKNRLFGV